MAAKALLSSLLVSFQVSCYAAARVFLMVAMVFWVKHRAVVRGPGG